MLTDAVVEAATRGDDAAFSVIYRSLIPAVTAYLRGQRAVDPDGLAADVFVAVLRGLPRFVGDADALKAWVFTIAHHRLIDAQRRGSRQPDRATPDARLEALAPAVTGPEDEVVERLASAPAFEALGRLSPDQRNTILLRVIADLSIERTAEILGKRPAAVKALQRRAIAALRRKISGEAVS